MNTPKCIIISEECLVVEGLRSLLKESGWFLTIEHERSLHSVMNGGSDIRLLLFIDYRLIPDPKKYTLERLRAKIQNAKCIVLYDKNIDQELLPFFSHMIFSKDQQKDILLKIREVLSLFNQNNIEVSEEISDREKEVLKHVALGKTNREISDTLHISAHTVITHRKNITSKLGIKTIAGLTVYAVINGIIDTEDT